MKTLNKKSMLFTLVLVFIAIGALTMALMYIKPPTWSDTHIPGKEQFSIIKAAQKAENDLLYIDQSAKYAASESVINLASNGGFYPSLTFLPPICGQYQQYYVWNRKSTRDDDCYPDYERTFKKSLAANLAKYFSVYPITPIPPEYEFSFINKDILGIAEENLNYTFEHGNYSINPSFNINIDYDISEYKTIIDQAKQFIPKCNVEDQKLQNCITQNLPQNWQQGSCEGDKAIQDRKSMFCVTFDQVFLVYNHNANKPEFTKLQYKFALYFPEPLVQSP